MLSGSGREASWALGTLALFRVASIIINNFIDYWVVVGLGQDCWDLSFGIRRAVHGAYHAWYVQRIMMGGHACTPSVPNGTRSVHAQILKPQLLGFEPYLRDIMPLVQPPSHPYIASTKTLAPVLCLCVLVPFESFFG